jgi:hypothetical protein
VSISGEEVVEDTTLNWKRRKNGLVNPNQGWESNGANPNWGWETEGATSN